MVDAQTVVALLNEASPDCPVSLMDFCQKSPQQLRELLMHVLSFIQPIQKDIDIDSPNASTSWVLDLLRMLYYHPPFDRGSFHTPWFAFWQHNCYLSFAILVAFRDEEANLQRAIQEQSEALKNISVRHRRTMLTIGQLQDFANVSSSSMLEKFSQECSLFHYITKKKLPKELETKGFHFQALSDVLFDTSNMELKIPCIQAKLVAVNDSLKQFNMQTDNDGNCFNDAVVENGKALYWEQAQMRGIISDKMRSLSANMDSLNGCENRLMVELTSKYRIIEELVGQGNCAAWGRVEAIC
ncbi:hypothetical protein O6H91_10G028000 [Diphasiastrum complanatum]|uniref:Uncharacterized protein n=1 Tax=Diphasiastrum complanatum TaxID=34168 RepID=A0ACC2CFE9_DIPCM|nr:hypothetical protein O6H91_10G028000 [Diphasiastrum complanatum]